MLLGWIWEFVTALFMQRRSHGFSYGGAKSKNCGLFSAKYFFRKRTPIRLSVNGVKGRSKWKRQYLYDAKCKLNFYRQNIYIDKP